MLKQSMLGLFFLSTIVLYGFNTPSKSTPKEMAMVKPSPPPVVTIGTLETLSNSDIVRIIFTFDAGTNTILNVRMEYTTGGCFEYLVTGFSGGPINFAGGAYRAVHPIVVTTTVGTATIGSGGILSSMFICL